jgi:glutamate-1-semialdehyde 2,1-aminomutase
MADDAVRAAFDDTKLAGLRDDLLSQYRAARPRSAEVYERAKESLPGGNSRHQVYFDPFPFYVAEAQGARMRDVDGNQYIDLVNNYTSLVHGHSHPDVVAKAREQVGKGTAFGAPSPLEVDMAAELRRRMPSLDSVRFANSGSEAVYYAIRTARAFTGRDRVIKVEGGYSGGFDSVQVSVKRLGALQGEPVAEFGVPQSVADETYVIPFNDTDAAVEAIRAVGKECACLVVEPLQGSGGALPADADYLAALREETAKVGCLLLLDEVQTLRLGFGGMQEHYGITPDLTALGKLIGGGFPVGAFGGRADVMDVNDPRRPDTPMHAGTYNANPVTLAAGLETLRLLTADAVTALNARGDALRTRFNELAAEYSLPMLASGFGSIMQVHTGTAAPKSFREAAAREKQPVALLFFLLLSGGVFAAPGRCHMNVSTVIGDAEVAEVEAALTAGFGRLADALA